MPELPEVETVRRSLEASVRGQTIEKVSLARGDLRVPFPPRFAQKLAGARISDIARRAKYLLFTLDNGMTLISHLGMSGRFTVLPHAPGVLGKHDHAVFFFKGGGSLVYNDARRFGLMQLAETAELAEHPLLAHLGPEPFSRQFGANYLRKALEERASPVKVALMDQRLVVGVGNIYACEALFETGIDPRRPAREAAPQAAALVKAVRKVLEAAIKSGGSSLRDFFSANGEAGYFQHDFKVYGREGKACAVCAAPVQRVVQAGRSTFFCARCQK